MQTFVDNIFERLGALFEPAHLAAGAARMLSNVVVALVTFAVVWGAWRLIDRGLVSVLRRAELDETTTSFARTALRIVVIGFAAVQALGQLGVDTTALLASVGIAGLTIGFAARDTLSNLISGLLIFWDRPIVIGDLVEIGGQYGRVERITLRSTRIVTVDGRMLAVPNTTVINTVVASYTNFPHLRLDIPVTLAPDEDLERARQLMLDTVRGEAFLTVPPPRVVVTELNAWNVTLELQAWLREERDHVEARFALREQVFLALRSAGVRMPVETLALEPVQVTSAESES